MVNSFPSATSVIAWIAITSPIKFTWQLAKHEWLKYETSCQRPHCLSKFWYSSCISANLLYSADLSVTALRSSSPKRSSSYAAVLHRFSSIRSSSNMSSVLLIWNELNANICSTRSKSITGSVRVFELKLKKRSYYIKI